MQRNEYTDVAVEHRDHVAWITINRPEVMNASRGRTCDELIGALHRAGYDPEIGAIVLAEAGDRAFCTGGDQSTHDGQYDGRGTGGTPVEELHTAIRDVPVPVVARVRGYAIGGGNVLATLCDLTICSESAIFGQVGPKMGSVDPGYGTALLARVVGEKKAREIWYLCRRYPEREAEAMGLVQHGHRPPGRHRRHGHDGPRAVRRDRGVEGGGRGPRGEAAAPLPRVRELSAP